MRLAARGRIFLARNRWLYGAAFATIATLAALSLQNRLAALDAQRAEWGDEVTVYVAIRDHAPDDPIRADRRILPAAAVPVDALTERPDGVSLQRIGVGEVLTTADVIAPDGAARRAAPDDAVVGVIDPLSPGAAVGARVHVASEGLIVASHGTVVDVVGEVTYIAVSGTDAAQVAHAAQIGAASLIFVP